MQISTRERNILFMAAFVAVVFAATTIFPTIRAQYQERQELIEDVLLDIDREQSLIENTLTWRERRVEVEQRTQELEQQVFSGDTIPLVEANISGDLSEYARNSGITVSSTRLADRLETNNWLMISQEMSFRTTDAGNTISLLERLENSLPRLFVSDFAINRSRNQYSGTITVVGFARSEGLVSAATAQR
ncbi:MAG: GspMb/PilO family protein [Gammaproteobacteria bacterium]|nr:GspMb/PilO family protein [Gammaproteobacteria bacterium]MDD9897166.1 GspMb/PilO family protein [Gammaproteobacteria bacterium]MDD9958095.1 GspMb/PilO family protein [Gammaproteobacteria bacterium]